MIEKIIQKAEEYVSTHWSCNVIEMNSQRTFQQVKGTPHFYNNAIKQAYIAGATELQEEMKKDLVSKLKELISYSTSPSCTKGMELFIKRIENWEFVK